MDGGGTIELDEFCHFLRQQYSEASLRIRDMTESLGVQKHIFFLSPYLVMVIDDDDESCVLPYYPPKTGILKIQVIDSFSKKKRHRVLSSSDTQNAKSVATKIGV